MHAKTTHPSIFPFYWTLTEYSLKKTVQYNKICRKLNGVTCSLCAFILSCPHTAIPTPVVWILATPLHLNEVVHTCIALHATPLLNVFTSVAFHASDLFVRDIKLYPHIFLNGLLIKKRALHSHSPLCT